MTQRMIRITWKAVVLTSALAAHLAGCSTNADRADANESIDSIASGADPDKEPQVEPRDLLSYANEARGKGHDVTLVLLEDVNGFSDIIVRLCKGGRSVYSWRTHLCGVFCINDDRLYYADYSTVSNGGTIVAVTLSTGNVLWRSRLTAIGPTEHSKYRNRISLSIDPTGNIVIAGTESDGEYVEVKRPADGTTIQHRINTTLKDRDSKR